MEIEEEDGGMEQSSSFNLCFAELSSFGHWQEGVREEREGDEWLNEKQGWDGGAHKEGAVKYKDSLMVSELLIGWWVKGELVTDWTGWWEKW